MGNHVDIRGLHLGSLAALSPVLRYWQVLNESWGNSDAPWWYNERASVGFLAGALWKYGDWVFEEFSTDKLTEQSKEEKYAGRCDIAFGVNGQDFWTEAKQCYPTLNGENKSQMVEANLDLASKQVRAGKQRGYKGLAVVFAVPKIKASQTNQRQIDSHISKYIDQLKIIPNITLAWTFPALTRYLRPGNKWRSHYFPGVIMALRPVK